MATTWNMEVTRGDRWPAYAIEVVDENGSAVTPAAVKMEVRKSKTGEVVKTLTIGSGFTQAANLITFSTDVDTEVRQYYYDIQVTLSNGHKYTIYEGTIDVRQDVTQ